MYLVFEQEGNLRVVSFRWIFPFLSDGTLVDLVSPKSIVLSPEIVCKLFYQVCLAVKHLHQQNPPVIHRDLKVSPEPISLSVRVFVPTLVFVIAVGEFLVGRRRQDKIV